MTAYCAPSGFFWEADIGYQKTYDGTYESSDPDNFISSIYGGYKLNENFGINLGYQYWDTLSAKATRVDMDVESIEANVELRYPLYKSIDLYSSFGISYWDIDKEQKRVGKVISANGFSPVLSIGSIYSLSKSSAIKVTYKYIDAIGDSTTGKFDSHSINFGYRYTFGENNDSVTENTDVDFTDNSILDETLINSTEDYHSTMKYRFSVYFGIDDDKLILDSLSILDEIMDNINPNDKVILSGYSSEKGLLDHNTKLSLKRAQSVRNYLIEHGVDDSMIESYGLGEISNSGNSEEARKVLIEFGDY
ncbi:OmpA family protein [Photobacterium damselae]|uniref:OmpA family protein n=1 Tax=Photobacterium damselae TaxID=38293 RepID=UPI003B67F386